MRRLRRLLRSPSARWSDAAFVVEGPELVRTAALAGAVLDSVYVAPAAEGDPLVREAVGLAGASGARVFALRQGVLERVGGTVSPQPLLAVARLDPAGPGALAGATLVVVLVDVRDPGNVGTILRTADASGADAVVTCRGTVDVYNPKVVRSSAGSIFHVPVWAGADVDKVLASLSAQGIRSVATHGAATTDYASVAWTVPSALLLGNESAGLPTDVVERAALSVAVPMSGRAESLNVATACAVVCFEALRQRRQCSEQPYHAPMPAGDGDR